MNGPAAQAKIINSTFSGNSAGAYTGGLRIRGAGAGGNPTEVTIINTTITGNSTTLGSGGGLFAYQSADVTLHNTIVAGNYHGSVARDIAGPVNSASSNNLVGPGTAPGGANNIVLSGADAGLEPLGDYGGPTKTHALKQGSPAIDQGGLAQVTTAYDQRGLSHDRVLFASVDIGAVEMGLPDITLSPTGLLTIDDTQSKVNIIQVEVIAGAIVINGRSLTHNPAAISEIKIIGASGKDNIDLSQIEVSDFPILSSVTVDGGDEDDTIIGSVFDDAIFGGAGNDHLYGGDGNDILDGGTNVEVSVPRTFQLPTIPLLISTPR